MFSWPDDVDEDSFHFFNTSNVDENYFKIPIYLCGKKVQLVNLTSKQYNGKIGKVCNYNEGRKRFGVKIFGQIKFFKPSNLKQIYEGPENEKIIEKLNLLQNLDFKNGILIFQWLKDFYQKNEEEEASELEHIVKINWFREVSKKYKHIQKYRKKLIQILEEMEINLGIQYPHIWIQIQIQKLYYDVLNPQFVLDKNLCIKHYGFLPEILGIGFAHGRCSWQEFQTFYQEARTMIKNKMYNNFCDLSIFYAGALEARVGPTLDNNRTLFFIEKLLEQNPSEVHSYTLGKYYGQPLQDHEQCLFYLKKYENYILSTYGTTPDEDLVFKLDNLYHMMFVTYALLGDMKSAKKCLHLFEKYTIHHPITQEEIEQNETILNRKPIDHVLEIIPYKFPFKKMFIF